MPINFKMAMITVEVGPSVSIADGKIMLSIPANTVPVPKDVIGSKGTLGSAHRLNFDHHTDGAGLLASSDDVKNIESPS